MITCRLSTTLLVLLSLNACGSDPVVEPPKNDLVAVLKTRPSLTKFAKSLEATGVAASLQESGRYTIFAPMDVAVRDEPLDEATVRHHILEEQVTFRDLAGETTSYTTLHTDEIEIDATETIRIGDGLMVESDITASNGVIHVIDKVLVPEDVPTRLSPGLSSPVELAPPEDLTKPEGGEAVGTQSSDTTTTVIPAAPSVGQ